MKMINGQRCQNFQSKIQCDFYQICTQVKAYYLFLSLCASVSIYERKDGKAAVSVGITVLTFARILFQVTMTIACIFLVSQSCQLCINVASCP
jgi:ribosome-associated toxin RatA of RatAB toxin-antitoxin module